MAGTANARNLAGTIESGVNKPNYGGALEYLAAIMLLLQMLLARVYLKKRRAVWPRPAYVTVIVLLTLLWSATAISIGINLTGALYVGRSIPVGAGTTIAALGYFWIVFSTLGLGIDLLARFLIMKTSGAHSPARRRYLRAAGLGAAVTPVAVAAFGIFIERKQYGIRELDMPVPGLHPDLDGFRVVQVSDLHVSPFLSVRDAGRVIDMANELKANLAVFTGDLISERGDPLDEAIRELIRLRSDNGVLGCMGNHEQYIGCRNYLEREAKRAGVVFLRHATTQIRRGEAVLNIAGVDYQPSSDRRNYLNRVEDLVMPGVPNLLLSHNPDLFPTAVHRGFQAVLSGHTHGGQVNVEILHQNINPARFRTPFTSGLYRLGYAGEAASCFVTNGIGTIGMPVRLGAPPEIALLRLRRA
jgi:predicted MPP superfamily phosphohydrolase